MVTNRQTFMLIALITSSFALAQDSYEPPEGGGEWSYLTVQLRGTALDTDAVGKAVIACNMTETFHRLQLAAEKLEPNGVYSVWVVKYDLEGKKVLRQLRIDRPDRRTTADRFGKLAFASNVSSCVQTAYSHVEVRLHPDKNPRNIATAKAALMGPISRLVTPE
ncbi:MAG: hypothetical protein HPY44_05565 [Armatimonadetes bacterium]|nr:hypothetical protein [Armatimonadota bacterium]